MSKADKTVSYQSNAPLISAWRGEMLSTPKRPLDRASSTVLNLHRGDVLEKGRVVSARGTAQNNGAFRDNEGVWDTKVRRCCKARGQSVEDDAPTRGDGVARRETE
jgi:hypothetical protein